MVSKVITHTHIHPHTCAPPLHTHKSTLESVHFLLQSMKGNFMEAPGPRDVGEGQSAGEGGVTGGDSTL